MCSPPLNQCLGESRGVGLFISSHQPVSSMALPTTAQMVRLHVGYIMVGKKRGKPCVYNAYQYDYDNTLDHLVQCTIFFFIVYTSILLQYYAIFTLKNTSCAHCSVSFRRSAFNLHRCYCFGSFVGQSSKDRIIIIGWNIRNNYIL